MQPRECLRCQEQCSPVILKPCESCNDGTSAYYWPCRACGYTSNGAQCERTYNCAAAVEYRRMNC